MESKHFVLKEYVNGYELSVSIDDNLTSIKKEGVNKFRADVVLFRNEDDPVFENTIEFGRYFSPSEMARGILKAKEKAMELPKGECSELNPEVR